MVIADKYKTDNLWRYLPWGLVMNLFICGAMMEQLALHERPMQTLTAELIEMTPPEKHLDIPSRKAALPQLSVPARKPLMHSASQTPASHTPASTSVAAVSFSATSMSEGNGVNSNAKSAQSDDPITLPQFGAAYLNNPKPAYPAFARRMGIQGTVMLKVLVSKGGSALNIQIAQSSGSEILDSAAAETVKNWRFIPARRGDSPVDEWVQVPVAFHLNR